jgi:hypothetical protein
MSFSQVSYAIVTDGGEGYSSAPSVHFAGGSGSIAASASAVVNNGMVTGINVINHGSYLSPPTIQIDNPPAILTPLADQTNATLNLSVVNHSTATNYCVVVTNSSGSATSSMVGLTVFLPPQNFSAQWVDSGVQLQLSGTPGYPYLVQVTTNLTPPINWVFIFTNAADGTGNWQFIDTNLNSAQRFYRALVR